MSKGAVVSGIVGGLAGGVLCGMLMGMMGMLPMVAKLVGSSSSVIGFIVHLGISAVIGVGYGALVGDRVARPGASLLAGLSRNTFAAIVLVGTLMGPSAFAGQINALGQWVPTSTEEGRRGWTAAGPTEEPGVAGRARDQSSWTAWST